MAESLLQGHVFVIEARFFRGAAGARTKMGRRTRLSFSTRARTAVLCLDAKRRVSTYYVSSSNSIRIGQPGSS